MTRRQFIEKAVRDFERRFGIPPGWWGTWSDVHAPSGVRVLHSGSYWSVRDASGRLVSRHDSRKFAISKARKL